MERIKIEDPAGQLQQYQQTKDLEIRNCLVLHYLYIVRSAAVHLRGVSSGVTQEEDLLNQGVLALMECMERFDKMRGAKFETFAFMRVRGALIDYIRKQDWVPHRVRHMSRQIDEAYRILSNQTMREPSMEEIAGYMDIPQEKLDSCMKDMNHSSILSFEGILEDVTGYAARMEPETEDILLKPEDSLLKNEIEEILVQGIEELNPKEQMVITLYYYEELKYAEIARVLDIGESRVCQIHTKAICKLKYKLEEYMR